LVSLISEASTLREPTEFKRIQDLLKAASDGVRQSAAKLANNDVTAITEQLLPLGTSANSIFARHARETFVATRADATIDENVAIQRDLDETVANLVSEAEGGVKRSTAMLNETLDHSRLLLLIVVFISIIAAVGAALSSGCKSHSANPRQGTPSSAGPAACCSYSETFHIYLDFPHLWLVLELRSFQTSSLVIVDVSALPIAAWGAHVLS
jgi:hypothetical protein